MDTTNRNNWPNLQIHTIALFSLQPTIDIDDRSERVFLVVFFDAETLSSKIQDRPNFVASSLCYQKLLLIKKKSQKTSKEGTRLAFDPTPMFWHMTLPLFWVGSNVRNRRFSLRKRGPEFYSSMYVDVLRTGRCLACNSCTCARL